MDSFSMEERRWDELNKYILVEIFARVGSESLAESIQFVCKSWYDATLDHHCWTTLVFPNRSCSIEYIKSVVGRSQRSATSISVPNDCLVTDQGLLYISEECPNLKVLSLSRKILSEYGVLLCDLLSKWKSLEFFTIYPCPCFSEILTSISVHCKNYIGLDYSSTNTGWQEVSSIVEFMPKIKQLKMSGLFLSRFELVTILEGCRELELLNASYTFCFRQDKGEISNLTSHIKSFNFFFSGELDDSDDSGNFSSDDEYGAYAACGLV